MSIIIVPLGEIYSYPTFWRKHSYLSSLFLQGTNKYLLTFGENEGFHTRIIGLFGFCFVSMWSYQIVSLKAKIITQFSDFKNDIFWLFMNYFEFCFVSILSHGFLKYNKAALAGAEHEILRKNPWFWKLRNLFCEILRKFMPPSNSIPFVRF